MNKEILPILQSFRVDICAPFGLQKLRKVSFIA